MLAEFELTPTAPLDDFDQSRDGPGIGRPRVVDLVDFSTLAERYSSARFSEIAEDNLEHEQHELRHRIAWPTERLAADSAAFVSMRAGRLLTDVRLLTRAATIPGGNGLFRRSIRQLGSGNGVAGVEASRRLVMKLFRWCRGQSLRQAILTEVSMAEARTSTERNPGTQADAGSSEVTRQGPLQTERGQTMIADAVVTKVASEAAREVRGVHELGGGVSRAIGSVTQRVGVGDERTQGVSVEVGEREAAVDVTLVIDYGESIPRVSQAVRDNVIKRLEGITGLAVTEVNVTVNDLYFPGDEVPEHPRVQ